HYFLTCCQIVYTLSMDAALTEGIVIGGIITGTAIRTLIPYANKIQAEIKLAETEGRDPVPIKFNRMYAISAFISIALLAIPLLATADTFAAKITESSSIVVSFFIITLAAMGANE